MNFDGMMKDGTLQDKVIIITGGGTGLGKSMGAYFMELGANLIITSRKQEVLDKTAKEFSKYTGEVFPITGDVRDHKDVKNVLDKSLEKIIILIVIMLSLLLVCFCKLNILNNRPS